MRDSTSISSFGGSAFDRYVFDFETTETGGADGGGAAVDAAGAADLTVVPGGGDGEAGADGVTPATASAETEAGLTPPSVEPPAAPTWTPEQLHDVFEQASSQGAQQVLEALFAAAQEPEAPIELDVFDDNFSTNFEARLDQRDQQLLGRLQEMLSPLMGLAESQQVETAQGMVGQIFDTFQDMGDFLSTRSETGEISPNAENRDIAEKFAQALLPEVKAATGLQGPRAAQLALRKGAEMAKQFRDTAYQAGRDALKAELEANGGAPKLPAGGGSGATIVSDADDELAVAQRFASRRSA